MEHTAAILVLLLCGSDGKTCEQAPESELEFASVAQCEAALDEFKATPPRGMVSRGECLMISDPLPEEGEMLLSQNRSAGSDAEDRS